MFQRIETSSASRVLLLGSVAIVFALMLASCCPPALGDCRTEKKAMPVNVEKQKP